ncbi:MAG TPA: hypothetical protein VLK30_10055 [Candidatus Limnocylindrales bacterium]|nr:hypothetical protein [Candidatus Limnocylindrales bacterium]
MAETLTRDAREIVDRAKELATARGATEAAPTDVLKATLELPQTLAGAELKALHVAPSSVLAGLSANGSDGQPSLRQLLASAGREADGLGHYQVDSIHLLLAMLYSDSPSTAIPLQNAGLTLYDLRRHVQGTPTQALRRRPLPSTRGVVSVSGFFMAVVGVAVVSGALLWIGVAPRLNIFLTITFVLAGWVISLCIHEFSHAIVAFLGGDRSVVGAGYLTFDPRRYQNLTVSLILPIVFLLLGGIPLPGGAVYINHSALRTKTWSSGVSFAGPVGTLLCGLVIAAFFTLARAESWITVYNLYFFAALAVLGFYLALAVVLNLLPVPGLDGFGIIRPWLPYSMQMAAMRYGTIGIYGVFIVLWFFAPARDALFQLVTQVTVAGNIPAPLVFLGLSNMRLF